MYYNNNTNKMDTELIASSGDSTEIIELTDEINFYNRHKKMIQEKYDQKRSLRYKCELNFLITLIANKMDELKTLRTKNIKTILQHQTKNPKIFYSPKYLAKLSSDAQKMPSPRSTDEGASGAAGAMDVDLTANRNASKDVKIFYSKKYRGKVGAYQRSRAASSRALTSSVQSPRAKTEQLKELSQFDRFKNMYLQWKQNEC